jgi:hypothetical protein
MKHRHWALRSSASPGRYAVANRTSSRRPTSSSTCAATRSPAQRDKRNLSSPVTPLSSTLMSAGRARFALNVRTRQTVRGGRSASPVTSGCKRNCECFSPPQQAAPSCVNGQASNIASLISQRARVDAHVTSESVRTSSICDARPPYKTSRLFIGVKWQHDYGFNMFGARAPGEAWVRRRQRKDNEAETSRRNPTGESPDRPRCATSRERVLRGRKSAHG